MRMTWHFPLIGILALSLSPALHAQRPPAIPGVTGTLVTPETAKEEKHAEDKVAPAIKDALTPEAKGPLSDLIPGITVVIRHGTDVTEGTVSNVDVGANEITVRYASRQTQKLVLADRASDEARAMQYAVEYKNDTNQKMTRYFRPKS